MSFDPTDTIYIALTFYALGTIIALASVVIRDKRPQHYALMVMIAGFVAHTFWIGTICTRTGHPPITNLPEATSFLAWTIFAVELALYIRYRVYAAAFFVFPLVLLLLMMSALIGEPFAQMDPAFRSALFITHLLLTIFGIAGLFIGLAFTLLAYMQDRSLKSKTRGPLWNFIPSLNVCKMVSYRALAIGFSVYTLGLLAGVLWSYKTTAGLVNLRVKEIGAVVAWVFFGTLLQSYISGGYRARRTMFISACAFIATIVAILGIARG